MPILNLNNPFHIAALWVAAAVVGTVAGIVAVRMFRLAIRASAIAVGNRKGFFFGALRVLAGALLFLSGFPLMLLGAIFVRYPRLGWRMLKKLPRVWREEWQPKPAAYMNSLNWVTVVVPAWAYDKAMAWHRWGVEAGYRLPDDRLVVRPAFVFYNSSVPVGQKMRVAYSSDEAQFWKISLECWVEERSNIYVPFVSPGKQMGRDSILFSSIAPDYDETLRIIRNPN